MLKIQEYLRSGGTLTQLSNDLGLKITGHPTDDLIILNYDQIKSPKLNEIAMECRALTLHSKTFDLVARAFPRFFNVGEAKYLMEDFDWASCWGSEKADGCYLYNTPINIWGGGRVDIGDIVSKNLSPTLIGVDENGNISPCEITNRFNNGRKDNWMDVFINHPSKNNRKIRLRLTHNHHIMVNGNYKEAIKCKPGDIITSFEYTPSESVIHFIKSSLLGDGSLNTPGKNYSFTEGHKYNHIEYINYIENALGNCKIKTRKRISGYGTLMYDVSSKSYEILTQLRKIWYPDNIKKIPSDISWIDDFTIAKLYMDDGSLSHSEKQEDRAVFNTQGFTKADVERLCGLINTRYNVQGISYYSKGWTIRINAGRNRSIENLWKKISPYIVPCMRYKLPEKYRNLEFIEYKFGQENIIPKYSKIDSIKIIENTKKNFPFGRVGFDIETTTHNYFVKNILSHNSLLTLYNYDNKWRVNTRGTFGEGELNFSGRTWSDVFFDTINHSEVDGLDRTKSYVFEFWSPYNKVVTDYGKPCSFLLTVYDGETELEQEYSDEVAKRINCRRPTIYNFSSVDEVQSFVNDHGSKNPTWEGVVLTDCAKHRWKLKNSLYVNLHHLSDNGNLFNPKNLLPLILNGEVEETLIYLPEAAAAAREMKGVLDNALATLINLWEEVKGIENQREFAEAVLPRTKFSNLLFQARAKRVSPQDLWPQAADVILKVLYNK